MTHFFKYQGTGNDFILIDNRTQNIHLNKEKIAFLCNRKFGIGADGLMLLNTIEGYHFKMVYFNADGNESTMCGNGGRCITAFAKQIGIIKDEAFFTAIDGEHNARFISNTEIALHMNNVSEIHNWDTHSILNTGSPHFVVWANEVSALDVYQEGKKIRTRDEYMPDGINVNFAQKNGSSLFVRTFERGVEDETLSCGTGVTACAIAASGNQLGHFETSIQTLGGALKVSFTKNTPHSAIDIVLTGPATFVFEGDIEV
jgi:diaminopimelate epimerase